MLECIPKAFGLGPEGHGAFAEGLIIILFHGSDNSPRATHEFVLLAAAKGTCKRKGFENDSRLFRSEGLFKICLIIICNLRRRNVTQYLATQRVPWTNSIFIIWILIIVCEVFVLF